MRWEVAAPRISAIIQLFAPVVSTMHARASFSVLQRSGPSLGVQLAPRSASISRPSTTLARALDLSSIPQEALYAGGAAVGKEPHAPPLA